jgi:uncharacterized protein YraI
VRRPVVLTVLTLAVIALFALIHFSAAQETPDAWTVSGLNLRVGPGPQYGVIAVIPPQAGLVLEGRNDDLSWLLVHTENKVFRGWVSSNYLTYRDGFDREALPVSVEVITTLLAPTDVSPALASISAWTRDALNVRRGPGLNYPVVTELPTMTGIVIEGANLDGSWVLMHTADGSVRGWMDSRYLYFRAEMVQVHLPILNETMPGPPFTPVPIQAPAAAAVLPSSGGRGRVNYQGYYRSYDHDRAASINLSDYPVVPSSLGQARAIFLLGQTRGADPHTVAKVGDCSSALDLFLTPLTWDSRKLGNYGNLQDAINQFSPSLAYGSLAASTGFVAGAVLDSTWADPSACQPGESPLLCEYRVHHPSVAIIMFGTQDVFLATPDQFDGYLREIVYQTMQAGIIPILSTFPSHLAYWDNTILYNQIVVRVALDFNIPLVNLWLALESLPNHGLQEDGDHMTVPLTTAGDLTDPNLQTGFTLRNLITLQTLDAVWRGAMY